MNDDFQEGSNDPFDVKYLLAAVLVAVLLPLMHIFLAIPVYLFN